MKLTVLIPVFNTKPAALLEAVYSILNQDDKVDHDIIIVDDGSSDFETLNVLKMLTHLSRRVTLCTMVANNGTAHALNHAHSLVKTDFVAIMGSDDISHTSRFRLQIDYLKKHPEVDVLGTNLFMYKDSDFTRKPNFVSDHKEVPRFGTDKQNWVVNHGTVIYRDSIVKKVGGYDNSKRRAQDVDLWGRLNTAGAVFRNITEVLYAWRRY